MLSKDLTQVIGLGRQMRRMWKKPCQLRASLRLFTIVVGAGSQHTVFQLGKP